MSDAVEIEAVNKEIRVGKIIGSPVFKYVILILSLFLIALGGMSVYEGQLSSADDRSQNIPLIIMSSLTLILATFFLITLIYVAKSDPTMSFTHLYIGFAILAFAIVIGAISLVCAVDAPNVDSRGTLLWIIGAFTVVAGVVGTIISILYIVKGYGVKGLDKLK